MDDYADDPYAEEPYRRRGAPWNEYAPADRAPARSRSKSASPLNGRQVCARCHVYAPPPSVGLKAPLSGRLQPFMGRTVGGGRHFLDCGE